MLMAEKKSRRKQQRELKPKFGVPAWMRSGFEETPLSTRGRYTEKAFESYLAQDVSQLPGVLFLGLKDAKPIMVGNEMMVRGIAKDGEPISISREEATGEVEILSWHEIYVVRCAEVRKSWSAHRYKIEKYGGAALDDKPNVIPEVTPQVSNRKKLSAD